MKAYMELICEALEYEMQVSVMSEEALELDKSTDFKEIMDMVENLDESVLLFFDKYSNEQDGSAYIVMDNEPHETVADYSMSSPWIHNWFTNILMRHKECL